MKAAIIAVCLVGLTGCGSNHTADATQGYPHGIAVLNSDYHSTALSLIDPATNDVIDLCLTSGSASPRLSLALSGDVVLPSQVGAVGTLALVDRTNSTIVWVDPNTCGAQHQLGVAPGFEGNPHDILTLSATKAYVTLYNASTDGKAGNGIVIVNPQTPALVGNIIVSTLATRDDNDTLTLARPDRLVAAGGVVFVTLGNVAADYTSYGPGRVLIIDPNTDQVLQHLDLSEGRGCSGMATAANVLVVGCDGDMTDPNHVLHSALFVYDISDVHAPALTQTVTAEQLQRSNIDSGGMVAAGGHVYFIATGSTDAVYQDTTVLFSTGGAYELGGLVQAGGDFYAADAATKNPSVLRAQGGAVVQNINSAPKSLLPPRGLLVY